MPLSVAIMLAPTCVDRLVNVILDMHVVRKDLIYVVYAVVTLKTLQRTSSGDKRLGKT